MGAVSTIGGLLPRSISEPGQVRPWPAGVWLAAAAELVRAHRVVAPDLPGLGASRVDGPPPVAGAREASVRYGWPLDVIDDAGHFLGVDQPEAFLRALQRSLGRP